MGALAAVKLVVQMHSWVEDAESQSADPRRTVPSALAAQLAAVHVAPQPREFRHRRPVVGPAAACRRHAQ